MKILKTIFSVLASFKLALDASHFARQGRIDEAKKLMTQG